MFVEVVPSYNKFNISDAGSTCVILENMKNKSKTIICEVNGGIGNQIFQLACSFSFAVKTGSKIILDTRGCDSANNLHASWHLESLVKEMQKEFPIKVRRSDSLIRVFKRKLLDYLRKPTMVPKSEIVYQYMLDQPFEKFGKLVFIPTIEESFLAQEALRLGFGKYFQRLNFKSLIENKAKAKIVIGIHVRRTDAITSDRFVPDDWFIKVLKEFKGKKYCYLCFTDSPEKLSFLNSLNDLTVFGPEMHPLAAIVGLSNCDVLILSKSTFSFWAAALSNSTKIILPSSSEQSYMPLGQAVSYVNL